MFNVKIDYYLNDIVKDYFGKYILKDFVNSISKESLDKIRYCCKKNYADINSTYCSNDNEDIYEFSLCDRTNYTDIVIAKHKPVYDIDNNYIGRELSYLLRANISDDMIKSHVYYKDGDYIYKKDYITDMSRYFSKKKLH